MDATDDRKARRLVSLALVAVTLATYWKVAGNDFISFDDDLYVRDNPWVNHGLTPGSIIWAFTHFYAANWHPITWISHMIDCQLFGMRPGPQHVVNLLFHCANTVLLFLLFNRMTGALWRSAILAGLFALHPLHVESVAWIAERKDVLSTFFGLLALLAYVRYTRQPIGHRAESIFRPGRWYLPALSFFVLGLMSKPMLITLPFVMLLLDYWPLGRISGGAENMFGIQPVKLKSAIYEKWPFFGLTAILCVVTYLAQKNGGAMAANHTAVHMGNALVSYLRYIERMIYPVNLSVIYPFSTVTFWQAVGASLVLLFVTLLCLMAVKLRPYLVVGWLWYLGTLVPVIGFVQVGRQSSADRYTYIPSIGLFIICVWGVADLMKKTKLPRPVTALVPALILLALAADTAYQLQFWKNGFTIFGRALAVTTNNALAENNYATRLVALGRVQDAFPHYERAAQLNPNDALMQNNFGVALARAGMTNAAVERYRAAIECETNYADAYNNLGAALAGEGHFDQAADALSRAVAIEPTNADVHLNLGIALFNLRQVPAATEEFSAAVNLDPAMARAQYQLGMCLAMMRQPEDGARHLQAAAQLRPDWVEPLNALAWILATDGDDRVRNGTQAVDLAEHAATLTQWQQPVILNTLAAAYAEAGRFDDATNAAAKAIALAQKSGQDRLAAQIQSLLALYQQHHAFHHP